MLSKEKKRKEKEKKLSNRNVHDVTRERRENGMNCNKTHSTQI